MRSSVYGVRIAVLALAGYWALLVAATHLPVSVIHMLQETKRWNDKVLHVIAFAGLAFLLAWAVPTDGKRRSRNVLIATLIGIVYAGIDELTQIPVGRTADWADFSADMFGILTGISVYVAMREALLASRSRLQS